MQNIEYVHNIYMLKDISKGLRNLRIIKKKSLLEWQRQVIRNKSFRDLIALNHKNTIEDFFFKYSLNINYSVEEFLRIQS